MNEQEWEGGVGVYVIPESLLHLTASLVLP